MRPVTKEQWQDAADTAEILAQISTAQVLIFIELGRLFGLVNEGGEIDLQACTDVINDAISQGVTPSSHVLKRFINNRLW